ncbi:MAG: hypothetical protein PF693_20850 [Spirochaetia bacterium]|nr:hypothetical protein [Spirochaetia bacterium]
MSSISIHNLDLSIERKVKKLAEKKHQSINKTVKEILEDKFGEPVSKISNRERFEKFCGIWSEEEYEAFCGATEDFNKVDPEDWK